MKRLSRYLNDREQRIYFPLVDSGKFNDQQLAVIKECVEAHLDITNLADPNYSAEQMKVLQNGLYNNINLTEYVDYNTPVDEMYQILDDLVYDALPDYFKTAKKITASKEDYSKEVAKLLTKELRQLGENVQKRGVMIDLLDYNAVIDCVAGKVYRHDEDRDRYVCDLGLFKNREHLGDAYNCSVFNAKKVLKFLKNDTENTIEEESELVVEGKFKRLIKAHLNYPKAAYEWVSKKVEQLKKENTSIDESELYRMAWNEYKK